uniref:Uncharacterized protein n=1 Tax=Avena sativa TaxID=4498 RepID=A0ACD5VYK2_AVESA
MESCWESLTSVLSPASARTRRDAELREQLLAREEAAASLRAAEQRLREHADALRRRHDEVVSETAAAEAATLDAERREREAEDDRRVAMMTKEKHEEELRVLVKEIKVKDGRVRVLEAILDTVKTNKKPVYR